MGSPIFALLFIILWGNLSTAQVKIGENPGVLDPFSILELEATNRVLVISRMSDSEMQAITPLQGALVYNTDVQCVFYFNSNQWNNLCAAGGGVSFVDNLDGTYTVSNDQGDSVVLNGPETVTSLVDNLDGTYTYTNENGVQSMIASSAISFQDNGDGTFTLDNGDGSPITVNGPETLTSLIDNLDGTYTYTNEDGTQSTITASTISFQDNGDGTFTLDNGDGAPITVNGPETVTTLVANPDDTYSYTNEVGDLTTISFTGGGMVSGIPGSIFFAGTDGNSTEDNGELFWDNTSKFLGVGVNTGLNDKLNVAGTIGVTDGTVNAPAYRFLGDSDTGMYRKTDNELAFSAGGTEILNVTDPAVLVNGAAPFSGQPLVIRASDADNEVMAIQFRDGTTQWHIDLNGPGLNFIETNYGSRFFMGSTPTGGRTGIYTNTPSAGLDVNGTFRVRDLPTASGLANVTVDANGNFFRSSTTSAKTANILNQNFGARWTNSTIDFSQSNSALLPIFSEEDYKDGGAQVYEVDLQQLTVKESGRYDIRSTLALKINRNTAQPHSTYARIGVNGVPKGAVSLAIDNSNNDDVIRAVININDILQLNSKDIVTLMLFTDAPVESISFDSPNSSNFTIVKLR